MSLRPSDRHAIINGLIERRFPSAAVNFTGGDEGDEFRLSEMRSDAERERRRLEAMSDTELKCELEFAEPASSMASDQRREAPREIGEASSSTAAGHLLEAPHEAALLTGSKVAASVEALKLRYGDKRPTGITNKTMFSRLNIDLAQAGKDPVSEKTFVRAKKGAWPD